MKELQYPLNSRDNNYLVFVPRVKESGTTSQATLKAVQSSLKAGYNVIRKALTSETSKKTTGGGEDSSKTLYIKLPLKPLTVNMSHTYEKKGVLSGSAIGSVLNEVGKNIMKNVASKAIESEAGQILGLDKLKNTYLASVGAAEYTPERNLYQKSEPSPISLTWTLSPNSKEEAFQIYKILKAFQFFGMTQEPGSANENGSSKWFVRSPAIWKIAFSIDGETNNLPKNLVIANNEFKYMVLTECNTSIGEGEFMSLIKPQDDTVFPVEIKLDLTFDFYMDMGTSTDFLGITDYWTEVYDPSTPF